MAASRYYIDIRHPGLGIYQRIHGPDEYVVEQRAQAKVAEWDKRWERQQAAAGAKRARNQAVQRRQRDREEERAYREQRKEEASQLTREAEESVSQLEGLLVNALTTTAAVDLDALRDRSGFTDTTPKAPGFHQPPAAPVFTGREYVAPAPSLWRRFVEVFSSKAKEDRLRGEDADRERMLAEDQALRQAQQQAWQAHCVELDAENRRTIAAHRQAVAQWEQRRQTFLQAQAARNAQAEQFRANYAAGQPDAVEQYCDLVLTKSPYPEAFPKTFQIHYMGESRMLVVEYVLPTTDVAPTAKGFKYVQARDEIEPLALKEDARMRIYDQIVYQMAIRTFHELFGADVINALDAVVFNGVVETIDRSTGQQVRPCIVSVQATKQEFLTFNLTEIEPKACFRKLKGLGSAQLSAMAAIAPIVRLPTEDARYIDGRQVIEGVSAGTNLASMDWEDFEHLIRELFEREFGSTGADVKVTRASRDGGVDAVILDPDPIRGGKFVVQAKRYTNTVSVSAVRDLYGTMINEGAVKGILVTTAQFGPDAYEFAKDKPITLLDGGNLLFLLQKHGTNAYIDLPAARTAAAAAALN